MQYRSHNGRLTPPSRQKLPDSIINRGVSQCESRRVRFERQQHPGNVSLNSRQITSMSTNTADILSNLALYLTIQLVWSTFVSRREPSLAGVQRVEQTHRYKRRADMSSGVGLVVYMQG